MAYQEKDFQTQFNKYCKYVFKGAAVFELKIAAKESISFNEVRPHQLKSLILAKHSKLIYKIPDDSRGHKPLDSFCLSGVQAYIVIMFNAPSGEFVMIDVDTWIDEISISKRKSLTKERAMQIGSQARLGVS